MSAASLSLTTPARPDDDIVIPAIAADGSLYPIGKLEAHRRGALHLAVSVFVFAGDKLLIQRRADGKYHSGGQWANTCCTHPNWGEGIEASAHRRLREEIGIDVPLVRTACLDYRAHVGSGLIEHERVHVFRGNAREGELVLRPDPAEVSETSWVPAGELVAAAEARPGDYTPWLRIYLARWSELHLGVAAG